MITKKHVEIYKKYGNTGEGFALLATPEEKASIDARHWKLINNLREDWTLVKNGLAADSYAKSIEERFKESCDSEETIGAIKDIA